MREMEEVREHLLAVVRAAHGKIAKLGCEGSEVAYTTLVGDSYRLVAQLRRRRHGRVPDRL